MDQNLSYNNEADDQAKPATPMPKRTMALHVAYVGSSFKGSAVNRVLGEDATVELVLEGALHKAGHISADNVGSFHKVKWSRASRTDKGVHSLGTVIALRMNVEDSMLHQDTEGSEIANGINKHLPPNVRVLSVQKVNKKFNARHYCSSRTYEYYLPCSMIDVQGDGSAEDREKIERLRGALRIFEGNHPFHNYTKVKPHDGQRDMSKRYSLARQAEAAAAKERGEDPRVPAEVIKAEMKRQAQEAKALEVKAHLGQHLTLDMNEKVAEDEEKGQKRDRDKDNEDEDEDDEGEDGDDDKGDDCEAGGPSKRQRFDEKDAAIKGSSISFDAQGSLVTSTYYRSIFSFTAGDPEPLTPGGIPCMRLQVHGQSFLLHHIRHMIGSAVAVTLKVLSLDVVEASLAPPARISLPLSPSHSLLLSDCDFRLFPVSVGVETRDLETVTGERLSLRVFGHQRKDEFRKQTLHPALDSLVCLHEWKLWKESLLMHSQQTYRSDLPAELLEPFLQEYRSWKEMREIDREGQGQDHKPTKKRDHQRDVKSQKVPWYTARRRNRSEARQQQHCAAGSGQPSSGPD